MRRSKVPRKKLLPSEIGGDDSVCNISLTRAFDKLTKRRFGTLVVGILIGIILTNTYLACIRSISSGSSSPRPVIHPPSVSPPASPQPVTTTKPNKEDGNADKENQPTIPSPPPPPPPEPKQVEKQAEAGAPVSKDNKNVLGYDTYEHTDCFLGDIQAVKCLDQLPAHLCIGLLKSQCDAEASCIGFNYPGGWLKSKCESKVVDKGSKITLYLKNGVKLPEQTHETDQEKPVVQQQPAQQAKDNNQEQQQGQNDPVLKDKLQQSVEYHHSPEGGKNPQIKRHVILYNQALTKSKDEKIDPKELVFACPFKIDPSKIKVSQGGEKISTVLGREESLEYPQFSPHAFKASCAGDDHTLEKNDPIADIQEVTVVDQSIAFEGCSDSSKHRPVVLVRRTDYVDFSNALNDWFLIYNALLKHSLRQNKFDIVFLDGHAWGHLDPIWAKIFTPHVKFVSQAEGCYSLAFAVGGAAKSSLHTGCHNSKGKAAGFLDFLLFSLGLEGVMQKKRIVIFDETPYLLHPRMDVKRETMRLDNIGTLVTTLQGAFPGVEVLVDHLDDSNFERQAQLVRSATVLIGLHSSNLMMMMLMSPGSLVVEISESSPAELLESALCVPWICFERVEANALPQNENRIVIPVEQVKRHVAKYF